MATERDKKTIRLTWWRCCNGYTSKLCREQEKPFSPQKLRTAAQIKAYQETCGVYRILPGYKWCLPRDVAVVELEYNQDAGCPSVARRDEQKHFLKNVENILTSLLGKIENLACIWQFFRK